MASATPWTRSDTAVGQPGVSAMAVGSVAGQSGLGAHVVCQLQDSPEGPN